MKYLALILTLILASCGAQYSIETPYGSYTDFIDGKLNGKILIGK